MPTLPLLLRRLCRVSLYVFTGDSRRLKRELATAIRDGAPAETLREVVLQNYLFAGFPRCINALTELAAIAPLRQRPVVRRDRRRGPRCASDRHLRHAAGPGSDLARPPHGQEGVVT